MTSRSRYFAVLILMMVALSAAASESTRHVIYLHGRIVQDQQSARPEHPDYGHYELEQITEALKAQGFTVTAEIRPRGTSVDEGAEHVVRQVRALLKLKVPRERIVVVGASMGAAIALRAAARLQEPEIRFALLGPCIAANIPAVGKEEGVKIRGKFLAFREETDIPSSQCASWDEATMANPGLTAREIVINTGKGHGFLYRPMGEWMGPLVEFVR